MIGWHDIYHVLSAMVPLYVALTLGYGSLKWWHMFTPDQSAAINRLNVYFILPLFSFEFTSHVDPFHANYRFIAADAISKAAILLALLLWANLTKKGSYAWSITTFSLSALNNTLVVGVPVMKAMYGETGQDLAVQSFVVQSVAWFMMLLFMLEVRRTMKELCLDIGLGDGSVSGGDREGNGEGEGRTRRAPSWLKIMKVVGMKLAKNPNTYACFIGLAWACISNRWRIEMPSIIEGSITIMSRAGSGLAMFCMGLFMAEQEKLISCGVGLAIFGMVMRFIIGPLTMALGSIIVGLHGDVLRIAIIQAALPQALTSFIFAKEYGLHANVLSTAVIFGTIVSLPVLIAYYGLLEYIH